ncbi:MAG: hypothetical protein A3D24_04150 [Candidatus Blackburnbacteria bacterium RIFCSPHIGHO2_02_FULL_39_13]|uniref:YcaO domain-containing protein n=1 Tax=Candidatus Blackburnbacteria bacterium RIFCSPLOWO2_01_FULL_40_20 TaxID=1797519 RepID=A0A1G1VB27_9BACT|nr:MAG: hypothetical protein A2694_01925 [Candidatus Blackburnbacteria bacterium RIFCSPHIGHO2_01_FULL_40_17]OGY09850.1 MAG: hypothetical protein A3D24_04150 [Candidatus Blackburnbacteria bacterium RIFCSPHIGHO2_02_FULL_39_13]OGY12477.1 MAG: hypothetical protein A3A77_00680 [Candidatus Blackburnbacteria bacterium RIFCSPLOWO2_01_FULL_40_20]
MKFSAYPLDYPLGVPKLPGYVVKAPRISQSSSDAKKISNIVGASVGLENNNALQRAYGEAIERYCLYQYNETNFQQHHTNKTDVTKIFSKFILYDDNQYCDKNFPYRKPCDTKKFFVVLGESLLNGSQKYLPVDLVYPRHKKDHQRIDSMNPSGSASGNTNQLAILNGLCEVIERDSLMCAWLTSSHFYQLPLRFVKDASVNKLLNIIKNSKLNLVIYLVVNDMNMVTVVAVLTSKTAPYMSFGSAMTLEIIQSIKKAIEESIMIRRSQLILYEQDNNKRQNRKEILELSDHIMVPTNKTNVAEIKRTMGNKLLSFNQYRKILSKAPVSLYDLLMRLDQKYFEPWCVDIAPKEIKESGFSVCKILIPGLHPLEINQNYLHNDPRRLQSFINTSVAVTRVNKFPHPFG